MMLKPKIFYTLLPHRNKVIVNPYYMYVAEAQPERLNTCYALCD